MRTLRERGHEELPFQTGRKATGPTEKAMIKHYIFLLVDSRSKSICEKSKAELTMLKCIWMSNQYTSLSEIISLSSLGSFLNCLPLFFRTGLSQELRQGLPGPTIIWNCVEKCSLSQLETGWHHPSPLRFGTQTLQGEWQKIHVKQYDKNRIIMLTSAARILKTELSTACGLNI